MARPPITAKGELLFRQQLNAALDYVEDNAGGIAVPNMTTAERDALSSPANGLLIYNSTSNKFQGRAAGAWVDLH